ncbi:MAG: transcription antitermination factor NusB [Gammaproteobacteria bacterium]|nr:transcription antitermination factor NusB [Gammaproteobacteria bacterium]
MNAAARGSRRLARRAALQAIYQWQATGQSAEEIGDQFEQESTYARLDAEFFRRLLNGVTGNVQILDEALEPFIDRPLSQIDPVERAVLRIAAFELTQCTDVPWRVVINESVELARAFGAEQGHRFVNGVLDRLAPAARGETRAG